MKRLLFLIITLLFTQYAYSQREFTYNKAINGLWGEWYGTSLRIKGNFNDLFVYKKDVHPSDFTFRLETSNMEILFSQSKEAKEYRKKHLKENNWYEFEGQITFYGASYFSEFVKGFPNTYGGATSNSANGGKANVKVRIAPFKDKHGIGVINIWYQDHGLAISIQ